MVSIFNSMCSFLHKAQSVLDHWDMLIGGNSVDWMSGALIGYSIKLFVHKSSLHYETSLAMKLKDSSELSTNHFSSPPWEEFYFNNLDSL